MMFSKFTGFIIAFALLYPSLAIGGKECFWCNRGTARNYVTCFITKLKEHAQFGIRPDILDDMQLSILAASDAITKTPDDLRIKIMNGALAGEISGLIVYLVGSLNRNADIMVGQATKLAGECYTSATGMQHSIFSDNLGRMVIDMLDDSAPNSDYDVEPSYDYIAGPNNNEPHFDYSYQAPPEGNQPLLPFNQQDSFLPENRGPLSEYSQPQYFQAARPSLPVVKIAPSTSAFPQPLQGPSVQESFQYSPRQDIPLEQTFQERPNQPSPIAPPPVLEYGLINPAISQQNNRVNDNQRTPNMDLRNQRNLTQNVPFNRQPFATENSPGYVANEPQRHPSYPEPDQNFPQRTRPNIYTGNQAPQFNNGPNVNYNPGRNNEWVPDRLEPYNAANRFDNLPQNYNQNSGISIVGNQPDTTQNFPGLLSQQWNRPLNNVPLNGNSPRPNQGFYNQPVDSASVPITNFGNNEAKQTGEIPQLGQNSELQLAPQDSSLSTLSNAGERLQPNMEQQRFKPSPNNWFPLNNQNFPSSDDVPIRSQPSNSWFPNFKRNNPDSDEGPSPIQTQNESENSKLPKYNWFPFFNRNKPESDSESEPTQVPIESRSTKAPSIQKPLNTLTIRKPKQPNTKASTLQKITTSEMPKTTAAPKSRISPAKACAVEFGEEMFVTLLKGDEFYSIFDEELTHDLAISVSSEVVKKAMQDYGLSKYANDAAKNCAREISLLPSAASSQAYAEKIAKSVMTIFYRNRLLKGNCKTEGGNVAEKILNVLKIVASNSVSDTNGKIGQNNTPDDSPSNEDFKSSYDEETQPSSEETSVDPKLPSTVRTHKRLPPKLQLKSKIPSQQQGNLDTLSQSNTTPSNLNLSPLQNLPSTRKDENTAVGITQKPNRLNLRPQNPPQNGRYSSRHIPIRPLPGNKNNVLPTKNTDTEVSAETIQEIDQESPVNNSPPGKNQPLAFPKSRLLHRRPGLSDSSNDNVPQINGPNPDNIEKGVDATETSDDDEPTNYPSLENNQPSPNPENRRYPLNKLENQFNNAPQSNDHLIPNNNDNAAATSDEGVPINNLPRRNNQPLPLPDDKGFLFNRPWNLNKNAPQANDHLTPNNNDNAAATSDEGILINNSPVRSNQPLPLPENRGIPFNNRPRNLNNNVFPINNGQDFNRNDDTEATISNEGKNTPNDTPSRQRGLFNFSLFKKLIGDSNNNNNDDNPLSDNVSSFDNDNTDSTTAEVATLNGGNPVNNPVNRPFIPSGNRYAFNRLESLINSALQPGDDPTPENANTATAPASDPGSSIKNPFNLQFSRSGNRRYPFNNRLGNQDKNVLQPIDGLIPANNENGAIAIAISDGGSSANDFLLGNNRPTILRNRGFPLYNDPNINNNDDVTLEPTISSEGNFPSNSRLRNNRPVRFPLLKKLGRDSDIDDKPSQTDDALSSSYDDNVATTFNGKNPVNDPFSQPNPLSENRSPFNKLGNQNSDVPQSNDDLTSDNNDGTVAAKTASDRGNNPNDNTNVESAANGGNLASNPFSWHFPLRRNRYPLNKFGDQDTNAPQTNDDLAPDNDGAVAAETASGRGNNPFNQPSPLPGNRRYPLNRPENQNSNVPESNLMPENDNRNAEPAKNGGNHANNLFNRDLPLRENRYPLNKFGDQDTNAPQTNDNLAPDNDGAVASEIVSGRGNNPFNQLSPLPGNGRYPLNRPENQDRNVLESSSSLIPENDSTETEPVANGGNPTNPFNSQSPLPGNRRYPFSRNRNQDNNGESFINAPQSSDGLTSDNTDMTAATATTSDQEDSVSESPLGSKRPKILPRFKSPFSKSQKVNVDEVDENAPQNNDRQNSDKYMYTTPTAVEFDTGNDANKFPTNNNQPDNNNLADNTPVENDGSSNQPQTVSAPKIPESSVEASSQTPKELNSGLGNQGEETESNERPDSLGKQRSKHKEKSRNDEKSTTRSKDNTRTTKPAVSLTTPVPVQSESPPDDGSEDKNSNSLLDTLSDSSAGNEIQFLMKSALESVSPDGFDYKKFTSAMTSVVSDMKKQHPKWNSDVTLKKLYVSTIVALIQDMQNIATKPTDYNIQPKPEPQPSSNSDYGSYSSNSQQSVVAASANSESSSYNPPTKDQTGTVLESTLLEPVPINNRPLDNYQNAAEMVQANSNNGPIQTNILPPSQNAGLNNVGFNNNFQPVQDFKRNYNNRGRIAPFSHPQIAGNNNNANVGFKRNILPSNDYEYDYNSGGAIATSNFAQNAGNNYKNVGFDNNGPLNSNYNSRMEAVSTDYGKNVGFIQPSRNSNSNNIYGRVLPSGFAQNARNNYGVGGFNNY